MNLLLDVGNSTIRWACAEKNELLRTGSCDHGHSLPSALQALWRSIDKPRRVVMAHVATAELRQLIQEWVMTVWALPVIEIKASASAYGVTNGYKNPSQLGVDRWLAMIAAYQQTTSAMCIVDCGTAVTVDAVTAQGQHRGGLIMPGLAMMRQALVAETAAIMPVEALTDKVGFELAQDTDFAVLNGTQQMLLAAIERIVYDVCRSLPTEVDVVMTGGSAASLMVHLPQDYRYEPDLVLQGLLMVVKDLA